MGSLSSSEQMLQDKMSFLIFSIAASAIQKASLEKVKLKIIEAWLDRFIRIIVDVNMKKILNFWPKSNLTFCVYFKNVCTLYQHWMWLLIWTLYSDYIWRESNFLASTRPVTDLGVCVCCVFEREACVQLLHNRTCIQCSKYTRTRQWPGALNQKVTLSSKTIGL